MKRAFMFAIFSIVLLYAGVSGATQKGGRWQLLGEQEVNFDNDHDRIDVKRNDGPFRELRIEVRDAPIEIREMVLTFGDGKKFRPKIQARFRVREGHGSHVIDLPGNRRSIDGVEFVYRSIDRRRGKGRVLLYAR
jgi:hypothetical protein